MKEAYDFKAECDNIAALLDGKSEAELHQATQFKNWTVADILGHLHLWNIAADQTLTAPKEFASFIEAIMTSLSKGKTHIQAQNEYFDNMPVGQLFTEWKAYYPDMAERFANVAHIGVTTYSWSFKVKGLQPILPKPYVRLTAPNGDIWEWNAPQTDNKVEGTATEFSQVVTQCRNVQDTDLVMTGEAAAKWMEIAQCFAGGPETPPAKGTRFKTV